jgi:hypothetical protein
MTSSRGGLVVVTVAAAVLLGYLLLHLAGLVGGMSVQECLPGVPAHPGGPPEPPLQPRQSPLGPSSPVEWRWFLLGACTLAFVGGHSWGHVRADRQSRELAADDEEAPATPSLVLQLALTGLLLASVVALAYETFAVAGPQTPERWPITFYARCANDAAPWWTLAGAVTLSILVGQWLAYQPRPRPRPRPVA